MKLRPSRFGLVGVWFLSLSGCWGPTYPDDVSSLKQISAYLLENSPSADYKVDEAKETNCYEAKEGEEYRHYCSVTISIVGPNNERLESRVNLQVDPETGLFTKTGAPLLFEAEIELNRLLASGLRIASLTAKSIKDDPLSFDPAKLAAGQYVIRPSLEFAGLRDGQRFLPIPMEMVKENGKWSLAALKGKGVLNTWQRDAAGGGGFERVTVNIENGQGKIYGSSFGGDDATYFFKDRPNGFDANGGFLRIGKLIGSSGGGLLGGGELQFGPADSCEFLPIGGALLKISCSKYLELNGIYSEF